MKKILLATIAVFVLWAALDFVLHGVLLQKMYEETASLWRPMEEMKNTLMMVVTLIVAGVFCYVYSEFFKKKDTATALKYGLLYGIAGGISMGYGSYSVMPLPYNIALYWFLGSVIETVAGAYVMSLIIKQEGE